MSIVLKVKEYFTWWGNQSRKKNCWILFTKSMHVAEKQQKYERTTMQTYKLRRKCWNKFVHLEYNFIIKLGGIKQVFFYHFMQYNMNIWLFCWCSGNIYSMIFILLLIDVNYNVLNKPILFPFMTMYCILTLMTFCHIQ